jgi:predicted aspartyl protease
LPRLSVSPLEEGLVFITEIELDNTPAVKAMLAKAKKPVPPPLRLKALIDTGASICATTPETIKRLGLPAQSTQKFKVNTAAGVIESERHYGALFLTGEPAIKADVVTLQETFVDQRAPFQFVLGMTALRRWNFWYTRSDQKLTIEVP